MPERHLFPTRSFPQQGYGVSPQFIRQELREIMFLSTVFLQLFPSLESKQNQYLLSFRVAIFLIWPLKMSAGDVRVQQFSSKPMPIKGRTLSKGQKFKNCCFL